MSSGFTAREAYDAVEQLHERGEKVIQNIRVRAKKQRADIEAEAAPPPTKNGVSRTTVDRGCGSLACRLHIGGSSANARLRQYVVKDTQCRRTDEGIV